MASCAASSTNEDLLTVFQPIVDMATGETMAYESLRRFSSDPLHGPDWWLEVAYGLDVGVQLELAMLRRAVDTAVQASIRPLTAGATLAKVWVVATLRA